MNLFLLFLLFSPASCGFFSFIRSKFGSSTTTEAPHHETTTHWPFRPSSGEMGGWRLTTTPRMRHYWTTTFTGTTTPMPFWSTTRAWGPRPISIARRNRPGCPSSIDAFVAVEDTSLLFEGKKVYISENGRINPQFQPISTSFPGVEKVSAAVYDSDNETLLLFNERKVRGFRLNDTEFNRDPNYPKDLPDTITFTPVGAFRLSNDTVILVSNLPENIRGMSYREEGKVLVYTSKFVYEYSEETKTADKRKSIPSFYHC